MTFLYFFLLIDFIELINSVNDTLLISVFVFDILLIFTPSFIVLILWIILRYALYVKRFIKKFRETY
jgi:hypothetical protein